MFTIVPSCSGGRCPFLDIKFSKCTSTKYLWQLLFVSRAYGWSWRPGGGHRSSPSGGGASPPKHPRNPKSQPNKIKKTIKKKKNNNKIVLSSPRVVLDEKNDFRNKTKWNIKLFYAIWIAWNENKIKNYLSNYNYNKLCLKLNKLI